MSANREAIPIFTGGQDFYVPEFEVKVRGKSLEKDVIRDIIQVSYKDNLEEIDSFDITINNWDAEKRDFKYIDHPDNIFDPGKELELWMGYFGTDKRLMIKGRITALRPSFPTAGQPTLAISGLNMLDQFRYGQHSQTYEKLTDSQIARQVAGRLGLPIRVKPLDEKPYPYILQDNKYDINFLMERARRIGYDLFVEESGEKGKSEESRLYFGPSEHIRRVTYELTFGKSLIEFKPELTTARQVGEVIVKGWDPVKKKPITGTATRDDIKTKGVGAKGRQTAIEQSFNQRKEIVADRPIRSETEAKRLAVSILENIAKDMVKGTGSTVGLPDLRAGGVIKMDGMGARFSGRYFIVSTTHTISDGGYITSFECRREEV